MNEKDYHIPVMPEESIGGLNLFPGAVVVDATFGGGGHSRLILNKIGEGRLFAFDQDEDAADNIIQDDRFFFIRHNFRYLKNFLCFYNITIVDAVLADLGVSWHHFDKAGKGFSFRFDSKLDMRMNRDDSVDAASIINNYPEESLINVFSEYGEIKNSKQLVSEIIKYRNNQPVQTTGRLREIAMQCAPRGRENKYLAKVFQALRIEVNDEIEALKEFLASSLDLLRPGGRLAVMICKNFMRSGNFKGEIEKDFYGNVISPFRLINRKVITPDPSELARNKRARSAKLRIAEKI